jgi:hypothetical protein
MEGAAERLHRRCGRRLTKVIAAVVVVQSSLYPTLGGYLCRFGSSDRRAASNDRFQDGIDGVPACPEHDKEKDVTKCSVQ